MAYVCSELLNQNNVQTCVQWVEYNSVLDQIAITQSDALVLMTPIASIYVLLIAFKFINMIRR
jgi:hypothetical protein